MDMENLSAQYRETADRLQTRLRELRVKALTARGEEALLIRRRIETLYTELCDLRIVMNYLKHYYDGADGKDGI